MIELIKIMRQQGDHSFTEILNRIRLGQLTKEDKEKLSSRIIQKSSGTYLYDALHIWAENVPVDYYNESKLEMIEEPPVTLIAHDEYPAMVSQHDIQKALTRNRSENGGLDYKIKLKQDARVMLTTNLNIEDRLINGQMGTVSKIKYNNTSQKPEIIYIKFDDENAGLEAIRKSGDLYARESNAVPIVPVLAKIKVKKNRPSSPEIQRTQFSLTLAWACTIHKVQGLTLSKVVFNFELFNQHSFNHGQVYVALSRVRSIEELYIVGEIDSKHIRADSRVHQEYERLRSQNLQDQHIPNIMTGQVASKNTISLTLLNIRSLRKHSLDLKFDYQIINSDVLAFTETRLKPLEPIDFIQSNLNLFQINRHDNENDFLSLALCTKGAVQCSRQVCFNEINAVLATVSKSQTFLNVLLLYRSKDLHKIQFLMNLENIVSCHKIDMVIGDFNINFFNESDSAQLIQIKGNYGFVQIVENATFVSAGSLLDHVYMKSDLLNSHLTKVQCNVRSIYYSDHDAVQICFEKTEN